MNNRKKIVYESLAYAFTEYFIVVLPIAIYVGLESMHKSDWTFLILSPEWSIATIFLIFQGLNLYAKNKELGVKRRATPAFSLIMVLSLLIILVSCINAYVSLGHARFDGAFLLRVLLFLIATMLFILFVSGAKFTKYEEGS